MVRVLPLTERLGRNGRRAICAALLLCATGPGLAHPHVFVDGGVDFVFDTDGRLSALDVTWLYDPFETLYILSAAGLSLGPDGTLAEADRQELVRLQSDWSDDFDGSAHLTVAGDSVPLAWPAGLDAHLIEGRLQVTFTRDLDQPLDLHGKPVELAFYETTYFFAFKITNPPRLLGSAPGCTSELRPFDPDSGDRALQETLAKLGREETPEIANVGAVFADRIALQCV